MPGDRLSLPGHRPETEELIHMRLAIRQMTSDLIAQSLALRRSEEELRRLETRIEWLAGKARKRTRRFGVKPG